MFSVNLKLYFVLFDDLNNRFKVYIDENGNMPEIELENEGEIEDYIFEKSLDLFYGSTQDLLNTLKLSSIEKKDDKISIIYNIYCYNNLNCKKGKFVNFDKNSIDLYRFASNRGL
jgi:hypothetical protein